MLQFGGDRSTGGAAAEHDVQIVTQRLRLRGSSRRRAPSG
jgi:hypothetical protein